MADERIALIGFGLSNRAVYEFLKGYGFRFIVRSKDETLVPDGVECITGESYLSTEESVVFRSPSCLPRCIKGNGKILSEASLALYLSPCKKIGVTGSDGKTTVSTLIDLFLKKGGTSSYLGGNNGYPLINHVGKLKSSDTLVCELSSFQLIDTVADFDTAVITGVTENHLDIHKDMDEYLEAKANILKSCKRAVINIDNGYAEYFLKKSASCQRRVLATLDPQKAHGGEFSYVYPKDGYVCFDGEVLFPVNCIRLKGDFNILNVCMAVGAVYPKVSKEHIENALYEFCGVPSRMELVAVKNGIFFYDSSIDSTPARTVATLSAFQGDKTIVLLGGYDKNLTYDTLKKGLLGIKRALICGANSEKIYKSLEGVCKIQLCADLEESIKKAYEIASCGDNIVLSPASASFDAFQNYVKKSEKFKETVRGL